MKCALVFVAGSLPPLPTILNEIKGSSSLGPVKVEIPRGGMPLLAVLPQDPTISISSRIVSLAPIGSGLMDSLAALSRRQDAMTTLDLLAKIEELATRFCADLRRKRREVEKLRAIRAMTEAKFASSLQQIEHCIVEQHVACKRAHLERVRIRVYLYGLSIPWS